MNSDIQILSVRTRRQEYLFVHFPFGLYRNNGCWVPGLLMDEYDIFNPKKNPAYEFCMSERFLAYRNGRLAGRVASIINTKAKNTAELVRKYGKAFGIKNIILNPQLESNTKVRSLFLRFSKQQYMKRRAYIKEI